MFNNVILDVAIGVVFIFLLYSLLATSIQEAIATGLALRARTLRDGIINGMLCNTPEKSRLQSLADGVWCLIKNLLHLFHKPPVATKRLGHYFYEHPIIKNYGSSKIFSAPSYLPGKNFSTILIDVLRQDFYKKLDAIIQAKLANQGDQPQTEAQLRESLTNATDAVKVKELLDYYARFYLHDNPVPPGVDLVIEKDTWQILQLHLRNSFYHLEDFVKKLETWYDDTMDRVSGWYKRRVQALLFLIGFIIAMIFNVDIIMIAGKLSTDKDARDQLVQLAIKEADSYKDDPRVKKGSGVTSLDSIPADSARKLFDQKIKAAKKAIDSSIVRPNQILALGWGDYGKRRDSAKVLAGYYEQHKKDTALARRNVILDSLYQNHWIRYKVSYVVGQSVFRGRKLAGFLLTALAICLGAPFWFDLLNKLVNIRATGKREENNNSSGVTAGMSPVPQPVHISVGAQPAGEEAAG